MSGDRSPPQRALITQARRARSPPIASRLSLVVIDAAGTTFRYRSIVEHCDGTSIEFFDAGASA